MLYGLHNVALYSYLDPDNTISMSEDGGVTWNSLIDNVQYFLIDSIGSLFVLPTGDSTYLRSSDKGKTWEKVQTLPSLTSQMYVTREGKTVLSMPRIWFHTSLDGGEVWSAQTFNLPEAGSGSPLPLFPLSWRRYSCNAISISCWALSYYRQ